MSLKKECIDIVDLITEPLKREENYYYEIDIDCIRVFCSKSGEDVTESLCDGCKQNVEKCPFEQYVNVDVSLYYAGDQVRNYVFSKVDHKYKDIIYIKNRKQLMTEMFKLKTDVEKCKNYYAQFGKRYNEFMTYAKEFATKLKKEHFFFGLVNPEVLPVVFHTDNRKDSNEHYEWDVAGDINHWYKQCVINVYCCISDIDSTLCSIRHEVIHYLLLISDMKSKDDDAIFHYLCNLYDAHAYKEMGTEEQELYDRLTTAIGNLEDLRKTNRFTDLKSCVDAMIYSIGRLNEDKRENQYVETKQNNSVLVNQLDIVSQAGISVDTLQNYKNELFVPVYKNGVELINMLGHMV